MIRRRWKVGDQELLCDEQGRIDMVLLISVMREGMHCYGVMAWRRTISLGLARGTTTVYIIYQQRYPYKPFQESFAI